MDLVTLKFLQIIGDTFLFEFLIIASRIINLVYHLYHKNVYLPIAVGRTKYKTHPTVKK